ncbi:MAG TPA: hypothetical protein VHN98_01705, partial [Acidimicrobiales bacterium]|nr:hypothetical protein [Acidimicrobiales bacterium]
MAPSLLEIAEAPGAFVTPRHPHVVEGGGWVFLPLGPQIGAVQRVRLDDGEAEAARAEVRTLAAERGLPEVGWWLSDLTRPAGLGARL